MTKQIILIVFGCIAMLLGAGVALYATLTNPFSISIVEGPWWNIKVFTYITLSGKFFIGGLGCAGFGLVIASLGLFSLLHANKTRVVSKEKKC